jgi:hypothetical protein
VELEATRDVIGGVNMSRTVFNVSRTTKTGKPVKVGDFDTVDEAKVAMLKHYKATPKRGKFQYRICEEELEEINGVMFRKTCLVISGDSRPFYKCYTP